MNIIISRMQVRFPQFDCVKVRKSHVESVMLYESKFKNGFRPNPYALRQQVKERKKKTEKKREYKKKMEKKSAVKYLTRIVTHPSVNTVIGSLILANAVIGSLVLVNAVIAIVS